MNIMVARRSDRSNDNDIESCTHKKMICTLVHFAMHLEFPVSLSLLLRYLLLNKWMTDNVQLSVIAIAIERSFAKM